MIKKDTEVKVTAAAAEAKPVKAAEKKPAEKKPAVKKAVEKKPAEKKAAASRRKTAKLEQAVYVQYGAGEWDVAALAEQAKADYVAAGHKAADIKKVAVYVKPQEGRAYYVVNDTDTGSVAL